MRIKNILTIAGFDPTTGAGMTADLATIAAHGFHGTSAITALTVQSTVGVKAVHPVEVSILKQTLGYLVGDLPPAGIKIGMLGTVENVATVAEFILRMRQLQPEVPVVLDPILHSSSGKELLSLDGLFAMTDLLLGRVDWITPNLDELSVLAGARVVLPQQIEAAVDGLQARYPALNIVVTGGHAQAADDLVALCDGRRQWMRGAKISSRATHGTGCAFSTALVCGLVSGTEPFAAAAASKHFVTEAIRRAATLGKGKGPMNLLWPLRSVR